MLQPQTVPFPVQDNRRQHERSAVSLDGHLFMPAEESEQDCLIVDLSAGGARVQVINDGAADAAATPGYGLTGMAERVAASGGTLSAGPGDGGLWRVEAALPFAAAREEAA